MAWSLSAGAACGGASEAPIEIESVPEPGYPEATSRLTLRLSAELQKLCHATLVAPSWALTAAHCFAGVEPSARGALNELERSVAVSRAVFHPGALRSGATRLEVVAAEDQFVAAHDLALVPLAPAVEQVAPVARWLPERPCTFPDPLEVRGRFGQLGMLGEPQTVEALLLETLPAESLLGPGHPGLLLAARGPSVGPGDSGSGVTAALDDLEALGSGCRSSADASGARVLMGVIQDANPDRSTLPFGLTPLYLLENSRWLATILATVPAAPTDEPPRLDP